MWPMGDTGQLCVKYVRAVSLHWSRDVSMNRPKFNAPELRSAGWPDRGACGQHDKDDLSLPAYCHPGQLSRNTSSD